MKYISIISIIYTSFVFTTSVSAQGINDSDIIGLEKQQVYTVTEYIQFNEGSIPLKDGGILLSNFGGETLDPLNREGKGYILLLDKKKEVIIPASGALNAPKGMAVKDHYLFIADVECVVVYNLKKLDLRPIHIPFPEGELFVNDVLALGDFLLISVTNTGHLYTIDIKNCDDLWSGNLPKPKLVATIPGANGMTEHKGTLYMASYNPTETPATENVIYSLDLTTPGALAVNLMGTRYGQYDGVAVSPDGSRLYFSNWKNADGKAEVGYIDLTPDKKYAVTILDLGVELQGPADISISHNYLFIPDLPANKLYIMAL